MRKIKILSAGLKYCGLLILFYVMGRVGVGYRNLAPFGCSILLSMLFIKYNVVGSAVCFLISNTLAQFNMYGFYTSISCMAVVLITHLLFIRVKFKPNKYIMLLPLILSLVVYIVLNIGDLKQNLALLISVILAILFYFVCEGFMSAFIKRGNMLNLDEKVCASVFLIVFAMGLTTLEVLGFSFLKLVAIFVILISTYSFSSGATFLFSALFGIGYGILNLDIIYVAAFVGFSLVSLAFKSNQRWLSAVSIVLLDVLYGLYINIYVNFSWINMLPTLISCFVYVVLPKKLINGFKDKYAFKKDIVGVRSLINRTKSGICKRLNELSSVFNEMDIVFRNMVRGVLSTEDANLLITQEIVSKSCDKCPDRAKCHRNNNTKDVISGMVGCGFERGKVGLLDVPPYLTSRCGRINFLLNTLNQSLRSYKNYTQLVGNMDSSRVLIADQLGGVSDILKKLGEEIRLNITFDLEKEQRILEELTYKNILCYEAIVYEESKDSKSVSVLLKNEAFKKEEIEKAVSNACNMKMCVVGNEMSLLPNSRLITLKNSPNYDFVFGTASVSKNGVLKNGDAHSMIKIENGKYILSLCDGIGSGEKAQKISNLSITLIENFYRAGFENSTILNSINKLLSLNNDENFSSVDLCVMDFHNNSLDFIKLGATYGFVKNNNGTQIIESSGLPIGVLEEMKPHITRKAIDPFDTIVLLSDGVSDAFDNKSDLQDYINGLSSTNPQTIADEIMDRAKDLNDGKIKDDMTVLVVRIFPI